MVYDFFVLQAHIIDFRGCFVWGWGGGGADVDI